ncbi:MAG: N-acetylneuraminate synthase [Candidatus Brocadia sp. WS118]|nr:MAG: N-acetylneuraminate synthase [Candidatus Brocadia sp. WS118]
MLPLSSKICLLGFSGHGFVVAEALKSLGYTSLYYAEEQEQLSNPFGLSYVGFEQEASFDWSQFNAFALGVGDNQARARIAQKIKDKNATLLSVVHPQAHIAIEIEIGAGAFIGRGACVNSLVKLGVGTIINTSAVIEHECQIADMAHIAPGAVLAGNVKVGKFAFVGANAVVKQGVRIGDYATIGAGTVVLQDIPNNSTVVGNPAKALSRG